MTTSAFINPCKISISISISISNNLNLRTQQLVQIHTKSTLITHTDHTALQITRPRRIRAVMSMEAADVGAAPSSDSMNNLLFVEMGVGYDQHGQDVTAAAMRACKDAISSNSIPAFRRGSIPGVSFEQMKLQIKLGVPQPLQQALDIERVKSVFPYGKILNVEVVDGGLICSSGVHVEEMGDKNDDCYIVNAAVYVGFWTLVSTFRAEVRQSLLKEEDGLTKADECVRHRPIGRKNASDTSVSGRISGRLRGSAKEMKPFEDSWKSDGLSNF